MLDSNYQLGYGLCPKLRWRRKKSHLRRCNIFSDTRHTTCMASFLKKHYALYMNLLT